MKVRGIALAVKRGDLPDQFAAVKAVCTFWIEKVDMYTDYPVFFFGETDS